MCTLESESKDEELKSSCSLSLACFSQALIQAEVIPVTISTMREVSFVVYKLGNIITFTLNKLLKVFLKFLHKKKSHKVSINKLYLVIFYRED